MNVKAKGYALGAIAACNLWYEPLVRSPFVRGGNESGFGIIFQVSVRNPGAGDHAQGEREKFQVTTARNITAHHHGIAGRVILPYLVSKLQLHGGGHRFDIVIRLPDHGSIDYGFCLQGKINHTDHPVHRTGFRRNRDAL